MSAWWSTPRASSRTCCIAASIFARSAGVEQVAVAVELLLGLGEDPLGLDPLLAEQPPLDVLLAVIDRVEQHLLDLLVGEPVASA